MSVDDEYCRDLPTASEVEEIAKAHVEEHAALFEIDYLRRDLTSMNAGEGGGHNEDHYTREQFNAKECYCFESLKWAHGLTFLLQILQMVLKQKEYYNSSQILQAFVIPLLYVNCIFYTIFSVKLNKHTWTEDFEKQTGAKKYNHVQAWLLLEIMVFLNWMTTSIIFVGVAYVRKFKSISKDEEVMKKDDNVWNDKDTDDFLRYLKFEYFLYNYILFKLCTEIFLQFDLGAFDHHIFGEKNSKVTGVILSIQIFNSCTMLIRTARKLKSGGLDAQQTNPEKAASDGYQEAEASTGRSKLMTGVEVFIWLVNFSAIAVLFCQSDYMKDENVMAKYWTQFELLGFLVEYPITLIQLKFMRAKHEQIIAAGIEREMKERNELGGVTAINEGGHGEAHGDDGVNQESTAAAKFQALEKKVTNKDDIHFEEDFLSMTIFSYLKSNQEVWDEKNGRLGWGIKPEKQAQMLYSAILNVFIVCSMLFCMLYQMMNDDAPQHFPHDFSVFYVKFPCAFALHFCLYPEVARGMEMMKFANNQEHQFVEGGAEISYCIAFMQVFTALFAEYINITLLCGQHTVDHCIIHFVALEVIMEVSSLYFESLMHNKLTAVLHTPPKYEVVVEEDKSRKQTFGNRTCFHKVARVFYKFIRCLYVSFIFYFVPFTVLYFQWRLETHGPSAHH